MINVTHSLLFSLVVSSFFCSMAQAEETTFPQDKQSMFPDKVELITDDSLTVDPLKVDPIQVDINGLEDVSIKDNNIHMEGHFYKNSSNRNPCSMVNIGVDAGFNGTPMAIASVEFNFGTNPCKAMQQNSNNELVARETGPEFLKLTKTIVETCSISRSDEIELAYYKELLKSQNRGSIYEMTINKVNDVCAFNLK